MAVVLVCLALNITLILLFVIIYFRNDRISSKIITPNQTFKLEQLNDETVFIVLDDSGKNKILQKIDDYQKGMRTNVFENTFHLDNPEQNHLKKLKTYEVRSIDPEGTKVLHQVSIFITPDGIG